MCIAIRWREIPYNVDLYFVWWWTWAFLPLMKARVSRKPTLITGVFADLLPLTAPGSFYDRPLLERLMMTSALKLASANVFVSELERSVIGDGLAANNPADIPLSVDPDVYQTST